MALAQCNSHDFASTLACGRCEAPLCARCVVTTAVGTRCRACAPSFTSRAARSSIAIPEAGALRVLVFLAAVAICVGSLVFAWSKGDHDLVIIRAIVFGGWIVSLTFHEFAHALTAYLGGDRAIRERGYLTLNPVRFMHPITSVVLPLFFVLMGGMPLIGGATMVCVADLRSRWWRTLVSLAGPATNLACAGAIGLVFHYGLVDPYTAAGAGLGYLAFLQVAAAMWNLIPLPPFDGFGALEPHLGETPRRYAAMLGPWGGFLLAWGLMAVIPGAADSFWDQVYEFTYGLGIHPGSIAWGEWGATLFRRD
ncbi:MAG: site-2 protease family protein [Dehalococcoidia bacterium]|nr:site-2 protease family protein [Dehalococcoidia bacterium]